ncbi:hypothetical protein DXD79_10815 [Hungatella hathewayi]|jgi:hypothetical protein|uniref:Uncharacterized protein n=1 Tax=Hungatella hathewayi TaxID=154046 RepID=A0A374P913_9FIRM|nr:hypothetical protein DWX31_00565 [Hungatella hathewayi]RGJ05370.1 hypothetical protein DXD79_10815 [Hungatella hathewayi]RGK90057.1 hypothetical protein DXC88_28340 [Hungatella hathewayi]RHC52643.1 hypothetical protein DW841_06500 [Hungatella hathewayi]
MPDFSYLFSVREAMIAYRGLWTVFCPQPFCLTESGQKFASAENVGNRGLKNKFSLLFYLLYRKDYK